MRKLLFFCALWLGTLTFSQAQNIQIEEEFKKLLVEKSFKNKTIVADFIQQKQIKGITAITESKGEFFYDNTGKMSLLYSQPKGDKVIMKGDTFELVIGGKKMTTNGAENPIMTQVSYMMQACMVGDIEKLGRGWQMSITKDIESYTVLITPTKSMAKRYIQSMTMQFDSTDITLNSLRIDQKKGGYTQYNFSNKRFNQVINQAQFEL